MTAQPDKLDYRGIARLRKERKIKQQDVARDSGISQALLSKYENGVVESPSLRQVQRIADAMGVSIETITAYCTNVHLEPVSIGAADNFIPLYDKGIKLDDLPFNDGVLFQGNMSQFRRPENVAHVKDAYAVKVVANTMSPRYEAGETVIVDPTVEAMDGDYVFASKEFGGVQVGVVRRLTVDPAGSHMLRILNGSADVLTTNDFDKIDVIVGTYSNR